ncbi:MAG: PilZ domain-containing protein [Pseudobdellovibrionaceae bacterium]
MKTQGKVWIIYDSEKKTQTKPMSMVQAQVVLLSLAKKDHGKYFLWTPGWEEWVCIRAFLESDQNYFVMSKPPMPSQSSSQKFPSFTEDTLTATHNTSVTVSDNLYTKVVVGDVPLKPEVEDFYAKDFNGDELDLKKISKIKPQHVKRKPSESSGADRRKETRHDFKIEVVLVSKIRSFRTYSKNISLSGTMLEHEIPKDFLNKPFDLIIVNPFEPDPSKSRLLFRAKIIGDMTDHRRLMFVEQDVNMTLRLEALLKAYVAYQEQIKKSTG